MEDPPLLKEKNECRKDKYLKCHAVIDLCRKYGVLNKFTTLESYFETKLPFISHYEVILIIIAIQVVPQKKIVMGYPLRVLVVEQLVTLCPTWVLFDRYIH